MAKSRERGTGSVYLRDDPKSPGQKLQTYWISYYVDGKRKRESAGTRKKSEAQALLKRRMGEHALGVEIGDEEKRLTFEDLEAGFRRSYENSGRRSLRRAGNAWDRLRDHFGGWRARAITANALESYAADRLKEAAPATVQYELAVLRRAMSLAVKKGQLRSRPHFPHVGVHNARTGFFGNTGCSRRRSPARGGATARLRTRCQRCSSQQPRWWNGPIAQMQVPQQIFGVERLIETDLQKALRPPGQTGDADAILGVA
jgi:hypothetical protein